MDRKHAWLLRVAVALTLIVAQFASMGTALAEPVAPAPQSIEAAFEDETAERAGDDVVYDPEVEEALDAFHDDNALDAVRGMTNILLIGLDTRPNERIGRSDTMILMSLDANHNCIKLTSFARDLYVEIPGRKNNRLNAAYVFGGPDLLMRALKQNFGVNVDHYVAVNFSVLASVIDQLGGLVLTVEESKVPRVNAIIRHDNEVLKLPLKDGILEHGGEQLMTGKQAQAYARYRYGDPEGDLGRTRRQREVILKCMEKVKNMSMTELIGLALNNLDNVTTDMSLLDMVALAPAAFQLKDTEVRELRIPVDKGYSYRTISGMAVTVPDRTKNLAALKAFILEE